MYRLKIDWVRDEFGNYHTSLHSAAVGRICIDDHNSETHVSIRLLGGFDHLDVIAGTDLGVAKEWCLKRITEQLVNGGLLEAMKLLPEVERQCYEQLQILKRLLESRE